MTLTETRTDGTPSDEVPSTAYPSGRAYIAPGIRGPLAVSLGYFRIHCFAGGTRSPECPHMPTVVLGRSGTDGGHPKV